MLGHKVLFGAMLGDCVMMLMSNVIVFCPYSSLLFFVDYIDHNLLFNLSAVMIWVKTDIHFIIPEALHSLRSRNIRRYSSLRRISIIFCKGFGMNHCGLIGFRVYM